QWFRPRDFHLREGPIGEDGPPIWLAGLGPKMVATAAEVADGVIANWLTEESLAEYQGLIQQGAESAGRDESEVQVATLLMSCVDPTDDAAVFAARRGIAFYCASEHYLHIADICGLGADARKVKVAWEDRDFDRATDLVSDGLLEKFCLVGTPSDNARRMQWLFDNSVYPIVYPLPRRDRMVEDHHSVLERAVSWTHVLGPTLVEGESVPELQSASRRIPGEITIHSFGSQPDHAFPELSGSWRSSADTTRPPFEFARTVAEPAGFLMTRRREARRVLPWELVEKEYRFEGPAGRITLSDLFDGRSQLVVYHAMFNPDMATPETTWTTDAACKICSWWIDNFDGIAVHLNHRDVTILAASRAP